MIKINLKPGSKSTSFKTKKTDGSSLSIETFNPVIWGLCLAIAFLPGFWFEKDWKDEKLAIGAKVSEIQGNIKEVNEKLKELKVFQETLSQLEDEEKGMQRGLEILGKILKKHNNPLKVLKYVAENIPKDIWLDSLELDASKSSSHIIKLTGRSLNFNDIDVYLKELNESVFFERSAKLADHKTEDLGGYNRRVEKFVIQAVVARYE